MLIIKEDKTTKIYPYLESKDEIWTDEDYQNDVIVIDHELGLAEIKHPVESLCPSDIEALVVALEKASVMIEEL